METIASAVILAVVTFLAFGFALLLHWTLLSLLFRFLPGARRARSFSPHLLGGKLPGDGDSSLITRRPVLIHPASPSHLAR